MAIVNRDDDPPNEDAPGLVLCGDQMTACLYRFDECARFHAYKEGALIHRPPELRSSTTRACPRPSCVRPEIESPGKVKTKAAPPTCQALKLRRHGDASGAPPAAREEEHISKLCNDGSADEPLKAS